MDQQEQRKLPNTRSSTNCPERRVNKELRDKIDEEKSEFLRWQDENRLFLLMYGGA